jgi:hypothetical protein
MTEEPPASGEALENTIGFGVLPEIIGPADLEILNQALATLLGKLRDASTVYRNGRYGGRAGTLVALSAQWTFLMRFSPVLREVLHMPLLNLSSALLALNENNVEPILKPRTQPRGGRSYDSARRQALVGIAVGAVGQLQWTGMRPAEAHKAVAAALNKIGVAPARGKRPIQPRTLREWCERVNAGYPLLRVICSSDPEALRHWAYRANPDEAGLSAATVNAAEMLTDEARSRIEGLPVPAARDLVLRELSQTIRKMELAGATQKPPNPPLRRATGVRFTWQLPPLGGICCGDRRWMISTNC